MNEKGFVFTTDSILAVSIALIVAGSLLFVPNANPSDPLVQRMDLDVSNLAIINLYTGVEVDETLELDKDISLCRSYMIYDVTNVRPSLNPNEPTNTNIATFTHNVCRGANR